MLLLLLISSSGSFAMSSLVERASKIGREFPD